MATEYKRSISSRLITDAEPGQVSDNGVVLPVIDMIAFRDKYRRAQKDIVYFRNDPSARREVRHVDVDQLSSYTGEGNVKVEYTLKFMVSNKMTRAQKALYYLINNKDNPNHNPPIHYTYHDIKIYAYDKETQTKDESIWVKVRRIDRLWTIDRRRRAQGIKFQLDWASWEADDGDYNNIPDPNRSWDGNELINPPWRIDPFQQIIDCSFGGVFLVMYDSNKIATFSMSALTQWAGAHGGISGWTGATGATGATSLSPTYQKTLSKSNWGQTGYTGSDKGNQLACQLKLKKDRHIALTSFKIVEQIADDTKEYVISNSLKYQCSNIAKSIIKIKECVNNYSHWALFNYSLPADARDGSGRLSAAVPLFNGNGDDVYVNGEKFTFAVDDQNNETIAVSRLINGPTYYSIAGPTGSFIPTPRAWNCFISDSIAQGWGGGQEADQAEIDTFTNGDLIVGPPIWTILGGYAAQCKSNNENVLDRAIIKQTRYDTGTGALAYYEWTVLDSGGSPSMILPQYKIVDGLDTIELVGCSATFETTYHQIVVSRPPPGISDIIEGNDITSFVGMDTNIDYSLPLDFVPQQYFYNLFPPIPNIVTTKMPWTRVLKDPYTVVHAWSNKPYSTQEEQLPDDEVPFLTSVYRNGLCHASNGKLYVQMWALRGDISTPKNEIFLNGKDFGSDLATALGLTDTRKIDCFLVDVKMSEVKKLA